MTKYIVLAMSLMTLFSCQLSHQCNWEECPLNERYDEFSDAWCIQDLHERHPDWTYEDCEYVLFVDIHEESASIDDVNGPIINNQ